MYEQILNFPKKNAQILKGVLSWGDTLLINPRENRAGDKWVSGYFHRRLKRGHPGHKKH